MRKTIRFGIMLACAAVIALLIVPAVLSLGVAPSSTDLLFEPGIERTVNLKIINNENKAFTAAIYAEGELAEYVTVNDPLVEFSSGDAEKIISYTVKLPASFEKQGVHLGQIVIRNMNSEDKSAGTSISANLFVISKLSVTVPYSGKYVEGRLIIPLFEKGRPGAMAVELKNLGTEDILDCQAVIDIYTNLNAKVDTLTSKSISLEAGTTKSINVEWTPGLENGDYIATANVACDEKSIKIEKSFTIGQMELDIMSISVDNFKLGGIAKFDIFVKNNWNEQINGVLADTIVKDSAGKAYTQFRTAPVDVPEYGTQKLAAYWDTAKVMPGVFNFDVTLKYLDKSVQKMFEIVVTQDKISTRTAGAAVTQEPAKRSGTGIIIFVLAIAVIGLIIFNIFVYLKKARPPKNI